MENSFAQDPLLEVLLIEDMIPDAHLFQKVLKKANDAERYSLFHVQRLSDALKLLSHRHFDAVILDLSLPDSEGLQSVERLRAADRALPIVVLTGLNDGEVGLAAVQCGVQDYLIKNTLNANELSTAIKFAIERQRVLVDASVKRQVASADHDELTGLPDRKLFRYRLDFTLEQARENKKRFAVLHLDLDGFKEVNDAFSREMGDKLLQAVALRLEGSTRDSDTVARVGGDKFALLLYDIGDSEDLLSISKKFIKLVRQPILIDGNRFTLTASIGASLYPQDAEQSAELTSLADSALHQAKGQGKNQFLFSASALNLKKSETSIMEKELEKAIKKSELIVYYQPQVKLETGQISAVQAIVQWDHAKWGHLPSSDIIRAAEQTGLILPMNGFIFETACRQMSLWRDQGFDELSLCLNLARSQFQRKELFNWINETLTTYKIPPSMVSLEILESDLVPANDRNLKFLDDLKNAGVQLTLSGLGTGNSSILDLQSLPISFVKIHHSLVSRMDADERCLELTRAIIQLAQALKIKAIADGVENQTQLEHLKKIGCDRAQGPYIGTLSFSEILTNTSFKTKLKS